MTFRLNNLNYNLTTLMRDVGYRPQRVTPEGELSAVRPLGADYPRFHIYSKEENNEIIINLHLDQRRPSYGGGSHAHSGDYDSEVVRDEAARIRSILR